MYNSSSILRKEIKITCKKKLPTLKPGENTKHHINHIHVQHSINWYSDIFGDVYSLNLTHRYIHIGTILNELFGNCESSFIYIYCWFHMHSWSTVGRNLSHINLSLTTKVTHSTGKWCHKLVSCFFSLSKKKRNSSLWYYKLNKHYIWHKGKLAIFFFKFRFAFHG